MNIYTLNGQILTEDGKWLVEYDPYNPLRLPAYTMRVRLKDDNTLGYKGTWTLIDAVNHIYDVYYPNNDWSYVCWESNRSFSEHSLIEVLGANTTGVTNMKGIFQDCRNMTTLALFDTSSVTDMSSFLYNCYSLTSVPLFDTSSNTTFNYAFYYTENLHSVPLFNTSNVTDMTYMFWRSGITTIPLFDTSSVTDMGAMFADCLSLDTIPLIDTSSVTNMASMFSDSTIRSVPLLDTSSVTNITRMFSYEYTNRARLEEIPSFNTSNITSLYGFADGCVTLKHVPLLNTSNVTNALYAFRGCVNVESGALALYQQLSGQLTTQDTHYQTFYNCGSSTTAGAAELAQIPSDWGGTGA